MPSNKVPKPADLLEAVRKRPASGGLTCHTCQLPNVKDINKYLRALYKGAAEEGLVVSPGRVIKEALKDGFDYPMQARSLKSHLENCLDIKA